MIKLVISTFIGLAVIVSGCVIYYWRDTAYDPTGLNLIQYFLLIPLLLTAVLLSPVFIVKAVKAYKEKKQEQRKAEEAFKEQQNADQVELKRPKPAPSEQFKLNIFSAAAVHHFGENEQIIENIKNFKSPQLDQKLLNQYGLPILSYRISELDELAENADLDDENIDTPMLSIREKRIHALIQQQLEQHSLSLATIAEHLKKSAMFYDTELAYQYRMHPRWIDPNAEENAAEELAAETVPRLDRLVIHFVLADNLVHQWTDSSSQFILDGLMALYAVLPQQLQAEHHFLSKQNAYQDWMQLLKNTSNHDSEVHLWISADSEIDQECLDERFWLNEQYIAAEYASSWCTANLNTHVENLEPQRTLKCALNEPQLPEFMQLNRLNELDQFKEDEPFLLVLDDAADIKVSKKLQQAFAATAIEMHHFLFTKQNLGHTQNLAQVFGFMLGIHLPEDVTSMIYSTELSNSYAFLSTLDLEDAEENIVKI